MAVEYGSLSFDEQEKFFQQKFRWPTKDWSDARRGMHSRAIVVAGVESDQMLADLQAAIHKAIAKGITIDQFGKDLKRTFVANGWDLNDKQFAHRRRVIYDTNLRQSYNAGREQQMLAPETKARRPYGLYRHGDSVRPRRQHLAWDGLVIPLDDPWWETHTPQNGWGCTCKKYSVSAADAARMGLTIQEKGPRPEPITVKVGDRQYVTMPGIDPGFDYNPGTAAWGRAMAERKARNWDTTKPDWETLNGFQGWESYDRPKEVPVEPIGTPKAKHAQSREEFEAILRETLGGDEKIVRAADGAHVVVNVETLVRHVEPWRSEYSPFVEEVLKNPYEVWLTFDRHKPTGEVTIRHRYLRLVTSEKHGPMVAVAQVNGGVLEAWTFVPAEKLSYMQNQRKGKLLFTREGGIQGPKRTWLK